MTVKMLTHAHGDIHMVVLALLRRRWSLSGGEGFGVLSPSRRACKRGIQAFSRKWNVYFPLHRRQEKVAKVRSVSLWQTPTRRWTGRGPGLTERVRSVQRGAGTKGLQPARHGTGASGQAPKGAERGEERIGRAARPVTGDRTRPIARGALWTPIGHWVQCVRSYGEAGPVTATALSDSHCYCLSCSYRTCPITLTGASGHHVFHGDV
jgi:hypothetical protein